MSTFTFMLKLLLFYKFLPEVLKKYNSIHSHISYIVIHNQYMFTQGCKLVTSAKITVLNPK